MCGGFFMPENKKRSYSFKIIKPYLIGVLKGFFSFFLLFSTVAFFIYKLNFDSVVAYYLIYIFIALCGFVAAVSVYKKVRGRGFLTGIISTIPYSLLVFLLFCLINRFNASSEILIVFLLSLSGGFVGGVIAANTKI